MIFYGEYFYPGTNVLINDFGKKNRDKLKKLEVIHTFERLLELKQDSLDEE